MTQLEPFDEIAPPPWDLVAQGWWFIQNNPASLDVKSGGHYHALELEHTKFGLGDGEHGEFKGELSIAQVYRYTESPVGPYDELIFLPGLFTNPINGKEHARISRIYVSSERSVYNGRKNWNIPKHIARFKFTPGPGGSTKIEVFHPNEVEPFFSAISKPAAWIPSFPFRTSWTSALQDLTIVQPPLQPPTVDQIERLIRPGDENPDTVVGSEQEWRSIVPEMSGKMRVCYYEPGLDDGKEYGDGVGAPRIRPWKIGLEWLPGMKLVFGVAEKIRSGSVKNDKKND